MRAAIQARVLVALTLAAAAPAVAGESACERALSKASGKFVGAAFKSAQRCLLRASAGKLPAGSCRLSAATTGDGRTDAALAHAVVRLHKGLNRCPDAALGQMGFDASCPGSGDVFGRADVERCIAKTHMAAVQALVSIQFPQQTENCGNGVVDDAEDCDPIADPSGCDEGEGCVQAGLGDECTCVDAGEAVCGNGTKEEDEACDPTATPSGCPDGMSCGAMGQPGECTCSDGSGNQCQGTCAPTCPAGEPCACQCTSAATCGNGTREPGEQCDPMANPSGCAVATVCGAPGTPVQCTCFTQAGQCGNGTLDAGEECDPALPNGCEAGKVCRTDGSFACQCGAPPANCGNGTIEKAEACDPGATPSGCPSNKICLGQGSPDPCTCAKRNPPPATCGNGTVDAGEECDPASSVAGCMVGETCVECTCTGGGGGGCGNGTIDAGEQCDPTANPSGCEAGVTCNSTCVCSEGPPPPPPGCDCCTSTQLKFTTGAPDIGGGGCGVVRDASGASVRSLDCGGLYFGGSGVGVPLPSVVPDQGSSLTKIQNCDPAAGTFDLVATTDADTGSNRNCTAAGVPNPEYPGKDGCLFGPPLPIPNPTTPSTSTCVVNRVTASASGSGVCGDGSTPLLNLPLGSDIYLTGDLVPDLPGIQTCPVCRDGTCRGGPKNGQSCTPGSSALGDGFPTSHDCPPPGGDQFVGTLPIPFALTTGVSSKTSTDTSAQQRRFCGFCGQQFGTAFQGPPAVPCTSDGDCSDATFPACKQRQSGAFGIGDARTISETGSPAGVCIADGAAHDSTLVSVFCIPPAFNATVDSVGDLPSPGAVALTGQAQLLP